MLPTTSATHPASWAAIAANPSSGSGPNRQRVDALCDALARRGLEPRVSWEPVENWLAETADDRCAAVIAAGGDGTAHRVLQQSVLREPTPRRSSPLPFAMFPLGTENLLSKEWGFSSEPDRLAADIARGETESIDLGRAGDRWFSLMLSAGFDAEVIRRLDAWRTEHAGRVRRVRHISYARPVWNSLRSYPFTPIRIETGRGDVLVTYQALLFNLPIYALRLPVCPHAVPDDGELDWIALTRPGRANFGTFVLDLFCHRHLDRPDVASGRDRWLRLTSDEPVPVQVDGEIIGTTPIEVTAEPGAAQLISTRGAAGSQVERKR